MGSKSGPSGPLVYARWQPARPLGSTLTVQAVFGAPDRVPRGRAVKIVKAAPK